MDSITPGSIAISNVGCTVYVDVYHTIRESGYLIRASVWLPTNSIILVLSELISAIDVSGRPVCQRCLTSIGVVYITSGQLKYRFKILN